MAEKLKQILAIVTLPITLPIGLIALGLWAIVLKCGGPRK